MFSGELAKLAGTFADADVFLLKSGGLLAIRCCIVGAQFG